ncbi:hypothetical protein RvY_02872 [Ramazzottius varieornatus]|uniref:L-Fucosyltransferase n=1 Tax=Ramazzottius varieornatus TaxID=947166 RepID=A0A1D1ULZ6_RAMVA|nr:hypothetical protein RvY_02872 [Ramazzottius varieornatus]
MQWLGYVVGKLSVTRFATLLLTLAILLYFYWTVFRNGGIDSRYLVRRYFPCDQQPFSVQSFLKHDSEICSHCFKRGTSGTQTRDGFWDHDTCIINISQTSDEGLARVLRCGIENTRLSESMWFFATLVREITISRLERDVKTRLERAIEYRRTQQESVLRAAPNRLSITLQGAQGGLGNFLFELASTMGVAKRNERNVVLLSKDARLRYFEGLNLPVDPTLANLTQLGEATCCKYNARTENLSATAGNRTVSLTGYLQSWKYFHHMKADIITGFTFRKNTFDEALDAISKGMSELALIVPAKTSRLKRIQALPVLIGVHVRRGDILYGGNKDHGHTPATEEYLLRAALSMRDAYDAVLFVVVSNDLPYCKKVFLNQNNFIFVSVSEDVDMAVMNLMDHVILSVGTFGFWSAYLNPRNRTVFYFRNWPRNGSQLQNLVDHADYFPPRWTAAM